MGCFSWLKADSLTKIRNIAEGKPFKFLIPKEFGGGFIKENYQGYGKLGTYDAGEPKYDMYELLAFWNSKQLTRVAGRLRHGWDFGDKNDPATLSNTTGAERYKIMDSLKLRYEGKKPLMKEIDGHTGHNRSAGITIGCYDKQINELEYPLKLVSASYSGTYEDLATPSYSDPDQGFCQVRRDSRLYR